MKAMILEKQASIFENPLRWADLPEPEPGPGEVRVRIEYCGICHTDLHEIEGELEMPKLPVTPGHQIVGVVDRLGEGVTRFQEGDRVGIAWLYSTCGDCVYCLAGKENLCEGARFTGYHMDGGFAQFTVVGEGFAYPIPEGFSDREAAPLLCAGIVGYRALRLSEIEPGERLGLYGFGASAHVSIQVARHWDCEVYVFSRGKEHRDLAEKLGACWTGLSGDEPPEKLDSAVIYAPAGPMVLDALKCLRKGGTLALAGIYMTPIPEMDYNTYLYHERTVRSVANSTRRDGEELLRYAAEIPIHTETQLFRLEEANRALQLLKERTINGAGVLEIPAP
jgi:propanol-preferring alcohol dehydrogenase